MVTRKHSKSKSEAETDSTANEEIQINSKKTLNVTKVSDSTQTDSVQQESITVGRGIESASTNKPR